MSNWEWKARCRHQRKRTFSSTLTCWWENNMAARLGEGFRCKYKDMVLVHTWTDRLYRYNWLLSSLDVMSCCPLIHSALSQAPTSALWLHPQGHTLNNYLSLCVLLVHLKASARWNTRLLSYYVYPWYLRSHRHHVLKSPSCHQLGYLTYRRHQRMIMLIWKARQTERSLHNLSLSWTWIAQELPN